MIRANIIIIATAEGFEPTFSTPATLANLEKW